MYGLTSTHLPPSCLQLLPLVCKTKLLEHLFARSSLALSHPLSFQPARRRSFKLRARLCVLIIIRNFMDVHGRQGA